MMLQVYGCRSAHVERQGATLPAATHPVRDVVRVARGDFLMGSTITDTARDADEGPQTRFTIDAFLMDRTPVSAADFARYAIEITAIERTALWWREDQTPAEWQGKCNYLSARAEHPVNCVNWIAARTYCRLVGGDLPTEAQWEYATRAGTQGTYWWGETFDTSRVISSVECGSRGCRRETAPLVTSGPRCNAWGLCDMVGNVWQWTLTGYQEQLGSYANDVSHSGVDTPVHRGGAWLDSVPGLFRVSQRGLNYARHGLSGVGFRCVYPATSL